MAFLRALAGLLLLLAAISLISDLTRVSTGGQFTLIPALSHWKSMAPQSLTAVSTFVQKSLHPALWDPVLVRILALPVWLLVGALGLLLAIVGRKKRRVNIYAN